MPDATPTPGEPHITLVVSDANPPDIATPIDTDIRVNPTSNIIVKTTDILPALDIDSDQENKVIRNTDSS
jgi:hypothetical protein